MFVLGPINTSVRSKALITLLDDLLGQEAGCAKTKKEKWRLCHTSGLGALSQSGTVNSQPLVAVRFRGQEAAKRCSFSFISQLDLGIPAMTKCCNQLDICYDTCGANKYRCDAKFRWCLHSICSDLKRSLGFVSKVEGRLPSSHPPSREQVVAGKGGCAQGDTSLPNKAETCRREQGVCPVVLKMGQC